MNWRVVVAVGVSCLVATGCARSNGPALRVVDHVDLDAYMGRWYEVARYPNSFEEGCVAPSAEYALRADGRVSVVNRCQVDSAAGRVKTVHGTARVVDPATHAKLKVSFFWPFEGDYWIIELDPQYRWAVIGEPRRRYLWVLSRTPALDAAALNAITARLPDHGYEPSRLIYPEQPPG